MLLKYRNAAKRTSCMHMREKNPKCISENLVLLRETFWAHADMPKRQRSSCGCDATEHRQSCDVARTWCHSQAYRDSRKASIPLYLLHALFPVDGLSSEQLTRLSNGCNCTMFERALTLDHCGGMASIPDEQIQISSIQGYSASEYI